MSSALATVSKILAYSCVDGPGNRFVIFLQGCNFNCLGCHNPHTIGVCNDCGDCISSCPRAALAMIDGKVTVDRDACDHCDACLDACPISANPMVLHYSVVDILELIRRHRPFLSGITVSGGEATLQLKFVVELFRAVKEDPELASLSCFVDSNGHLGASGWEKLLPVTDGVMLDVKAFGRSTHIDLTSRDNSRSLQSVRLLHAAGKLHELRFLIIPGRTDSDAELDSLAEFVKSLGGDVQVKLNAFQHHGVRGEALGWDTANESGVVAAAERLRAAGVDKVVTPAVYV